MGALIGGIRTIVLILPCIGTAFVAMSGRNPDSFPNPEIGPVLGKKIEAYIDPVRATQHNLMVIKTLASDEAVVKTAHIWLQDYRADRLKPLPSVGTCDTTRDGVKGQILNSRNLVISNLIRVGDDAVLKHQPAKASERYRMALEIAEIARDSDLNALATSLSYENAAWMRLWRIDPSTEPHLNQRDHERFNHLLNREFGNLLRQPALSSKDHERMRTIFDRARRQEGSFAELLSTGDYELSLMLAAARRIESLLACRAQFSTKLVAINNEF